MEDAAKDAPAPSPVNQEKLAKLQRMAANVRTGGKGTVRRKKKAIHKAAPTDDKRLQSTIKRLGLNTIPGIESVNLFREDGQVINFTNPKVQASIGANTYVVSGPTMTKSMEDVMPDFLGAGAGLGGPGGPDAAGMAKIQALMQQMQQQSAAGAAAAGDDDVPDLVGANFDDAAEKEKAAAGEATETAAGDEPPPLEEAKE
eukprot:CAMPEP_0198319604 /NCGR_PEP_ID=MMETSP1450-20131203/8715_1 /TAXON_ID=753684 ORGANISM="Madagascaria erythrocladiodes, Strain CCMP3234" /NCGR_SAMPLE_ID=MMETSP1450 /ASSEMBLY_ACC=CAM_ASM_001115 /LENGTH=200 /DNA_ID=CAMNT_0044022997 /DNA_START=128 /DNA_END=730 /DNA_ORIENTATION=-